MTTPIRSVLLTTPHLESSQMTFELPVSKPQTQRKEVKVMPYSGSSTFGPNENSVIQFKWPQSAHWVAPGTTKLCGKITLKGDGNAMGFTMSMASIIQSLRQFASGGEQISFVRQYNVWRSFVESMAISPERRNTSDSASGYFLTGSADKWEVDPKTGWVRHPVTAPIDGTTGSYTCSFEIPLVDGLLSGTKAVPLKYSSLFTEITLESASTAFTHVADYTLSGLYIQSSLIKLDDSEQAVMDELYAKSGITIGCTSVDTGVDTLMSTSQGNQVFNYSSPRTSLRNILVGLRDTSLIGKTASDSFARTTGGLTSWQIATAGESIPEQPVDLVRCSASSYKMLSDLFKASTGTITSLNYFGCLKPDGTGRQTYEGADLASSTVGYLAQGSQFLIGMDFSSYPDRLSGRVGLNQPFSLNVSGASPSAMNCNVTTFTEYDMLVSFTLGGVQVTA